MRVKITLACTECKQRNYNTKKNKKNSPDRLEMKKVVWPNKKQIINNTLGVLVGVLLSAVVIFILDAVFGFGLSTVLDLLAKV